MGISTRVRKVLEQRVLTAAGVPTSIAYEGVRFDPTPGTAWMRLTVAPAGNVPFSVSALTHEHVGVFQISLFYPTGRGAGAAEVVADAVRAVFAPGTRLGSGTETIIIDSASRAAAVYQDSTWVHIPIQVFWRTYSGSN